MKKRGASMKRGAMSGDRGAGNACPGFWEAWRYVDQAKLPCLIPSGRLVALRCLLRGRRQRLGRLHYLGSAFET